MHKKYSLIILTVLIIAAALLMVFVKRPVTTPTENEETEQRQSNFSSAEVDKDLTEVQRQLFYNVGPDATEEQREAHYQLAVTHAKYGTGISINECKATPDVLKVIAGEAFVVRNTGNTEIKFGVDADNMIEIKPGVSVEIRPEMFKLGSALYGYGCDDPEVKRAIGLILVVPK